MLSFVPQMTGQEDVPFYSGASIRVQIDATRFAVATVTAKQSIDRKEVRLSGQDNAGFTAGFISRSGSMEMTKEWADLFIEELNKKFGGWSGGSFNITIVVAEEGRSYKKVSTIVLSGCRIKEFEQTFNIESADGIKVKFDLDVATITINGIDAVSATEVAARSAA